MIDAATILKRRELVWNLVLRTLKVRYKGSALGFFWTLLNPLAMMAIYYVFISILADLRSNFITSLLTGVIFWQFGAMCVGDASNCIAGNANLVKKTYFPRLILPISMVFANFINYLLSLVVLAVLLTVIGLTSGGTLDMTVIWLLPLVLILQFFLVSGLSFIVSSTNVFFKDVGHVVTIIMMALFFMSPIIYTIDMVKESSLNERFPMLLNIYLLNPFASLVTLFRKAFLGAEVELPVVWAFPISLMLPVVVLLIGLYLFNRLEPYFADEL